MGAPAHPLHRPSESGLAHCNKTAVKPDVESGVESVLKR